MPVESVRISKRIRKTRNLLMHMAKESTSVWTAKWSSVNSREGKEIVQEFKS